MTAGAFSAEIIGGDLRERSDSDSAEQPGPSVSDQSRAAIRGLFGRDSVYIMLWSIQIMLAALLTPVTTRLFGASRFGQVASSIAVMQVLVCIGSFSLQTAIQRAHAGPDGERRAARLLGFAIALSTTICVVFLATGTLWAPLIGLGRFSPTIRYAVIWAGLTAITNAAFGIVRSRDQLAWFAVMSLLQSVVAEAIALAVIIFVRRTPAGYVGSQMATQGVAVIVGLLVARPRFPRRGDTPWLIEALKYSAALVPALLSNYVVDSSDRLVIHGDLGASAVGRYAVARNIGGYGTILLSLIIGVWMPRFFAIKDPRIQRQVLAVSRDGIYSLTAAVVLVLTMASPLVLWIWVPASFAPGGLLPVTAIVTVAALPVAGVISVCQLLLLRDRTLPIAIATIAAAVMNLGLNLALVPQLGIEGSALITLCCYCLELLLLQRIASNVFALPRPPSRLIVLIAVAAGVSLASPALPATAAGALVRVLVAGLASSLFCAQILATLAPERLPRFFRVLSRFAIVHPPVNSDPSIGETLVTPPLQTDRWIADSVAR